MTFRSVGEVNQWFESYYKHPEPDRVADAVKTLSHAGKIGDFNVLQLANTPFLPNPNTERMNIYSPCVFEISQLFKRHPDRIMDWMKSFRVLPEQSLRGLIEAVWISNTSQGREVLEKFKESTMKISTFAEEVLKRTRVDIDVIDLTAPCLFDLAWSAFFISGDTKYIGRLMDSIPRILSATNRVLDEKQVIAAFIPWSIQKRGQEHPQIMDYVRMRLATLPGPLADLFKSNVN